LTDSDDNDNNNIREDEDIDLPDITLSHSSDDDALQGVVAQDVPTFPAKLIARLLHEHFQNQETRITKEALEVVCRYVDVFAREAVARCCFGKESEEGGGGADGDFLEVSFESDPILPGHVMRLRMHRRQTTLAEISNRKQEEEHYTEQYLIHFRLKILKNLRRNYCWISKN